MSRRTIFALIIIFLAFFLGGSTDTGFSFVDRMLLDMGISPWTNGQSGVHITAFIFLLIILIGIIFARKELSFKKLVLILALFLIFTPPAISFCKPFYYKMQTGLRCIEYEPRNSRLEYETHNNNMEIKGSIVLVNYGSDPIEFGVKIQKNDFFECLQEDHIISDTDGSNKFILNPGEKNDIYINTSVSLKNHYNGRGFTNYPNIILYTENETRLLGRNL